MCVVVTMGGTDALVTASTKARMNSSDSSTKAGTTKAGTTRAGTTKAGTTEGNSAAKTCGGGENGCSRDDRSGSYC